jgi:electron transfer flavoprotein alpha subunit
MVLVLMEHADGEVEKLSLQALTLADQLADGGAVHALLIGPGAHEAASGLGVYGVATAHLAENDALAAFAPDAWARIVVDVADRLSAGAVLAAGNEWGNEILARVAARTRLPFAANVIAVTPGEPLTITRVRWGGSLLEEARLHAARALLTTAAQAIAPRAADGTGTVAVEAFTPELDEADLRVQVKDHVAPQGDGVSLAEARVVVSGGRGTGGAEGFGIIEELAGLLGGAVGCSRVVTSAGWRPHTDQVGQTGTKIAPDVYIPCGISGATQHMAGCKGAKTIIAINADPQASIMMNADYAVIGDLHEIVPAISAELRRVKGA